jgi:hypothetical protein
VSNIVVDGSTVDDRGASLEMGKSCFGDVKYREDVSIEGILELFCRQLQERRLFQLCSCVIDQNLKVS